MKSRLLLLPAIGALLIGLVACASPSAPTSPGSDEPLDGVAQESSAPEEPAEPAAPSLAIGELESGQIPVSIGDYTVVGPDQAASWGFGCKGDREWTVSSGVSQYGIYYANAEGVETLRPSVEALASPEYPCRSALTDHNPHPGVINVRIERTEDAAEDLKCNTTKGLYCSVRYSTGWKVILRTEWDSSGPSDEEREEFRAWFDAFLDNSPLVARLSGGGGALD